MLFSKNCVEDIIYFVDRITTEEQNPRMIIKDDAFKRAILSALADKEVMAILESAMLHAKSANDIIKETGIPYTTTYRKIRWMLDGGLLIVERIQLTEDGKKSSLFRSTLRSMAVKYEYGNTFVEAEQNVDTMAKTAERFFSLDFSEEK